jgi:hypothetical protein
MVVDQKKEAARMTDPETPLAKRSGQTSKNRSGILAINFMYMIQQISIVPQINDFS